MIQTKKTDVLWDVDRYYFSKDQNNNQEAGRFIQKLVERWKLKDIRWVSDGLENGSKEIKILGVSKHIGQARFAAQQLTEWLGSNTREKGTKNQEALELLDTAVVLADENLLLPMLNSLPEIKGPDGQIVEFNVTMGYPLMNSSYANLLNSWL